MPRGGKPEPLRDTAARKSGQLRGHPTKGDNMDRAQKVQADTERYELILKTIRAEQPVSNEEIQWFAETSFEFAKTLAALFTDLGRIQGQANVLINAITKHADPKSTNPAIIEAVVKLAIVMGVVTPEDFFSDDDSTEVLQ